MKTYMSGIALMVLLAFSCSTNGESSPSDDDGGLNVEATYGLLLAANGVLTDAMLDADAQTINLVPGTNFGNSPQAEQFYRDGEEWSFYRSESDCTGTLTRYDFSDFSSETLSVFEDLANCELVLKAMAHSGGQYFLAYELPGSGLKEKDFFVRIVDATGELPVVSDIEFEEELLALVVSGNRLFALAQYEDERRSLHVLDTGSGAAVHELDLDFDAEKLYKTNQGDIMVSYPELHLIVDRNSLAVITTVRYEEGTEPKFDLAATAQFDGEGNLYYPLFTDLEGTSYPNIPGVYDFGTNTAVLYFYENFLTQEERDFEFEIGDTSVVAYDEANNLILIGYQKLGDSNSGGLLRIRPIPEPAFIDQIDLTGVPLEIFVQH